MASQNQLAPKKAKPVYGASQLLDHIKTNDDHTPGTVANVRPEFKAWKHYWFDTADQTESWLRAKRHNMARRGYEPLTGPLSVDPDAVEYVPSVPTAEIWRASPEVAQILTDERISRARGLRGWSAMQRTRQWSRDPG